MRVTSRGCLTLGVIVFVTFMVVASLMPWDKPPPPFSLADYPGLAWLAQTRDGLVAAYHEESLSVSYRDDHALGIAFVNTGFNNIESSEEKIARAREIARNAARTARGST